MDNKPLLLEIGGQPYKIQISKTDDVLNIMLTNTWTKTSYASALDDEAIYHVTEKAKFIRTIDQFYDFLLKGALNEENGAFKLAGKNNTMDNMLILFLDVKLGLGSDETILYVVELFKINKETATRVEEMAIDLHERFGKPMNILENYSKIIEDTKNNCRELVNVAIDDASRALVQLINTINTNTKTELVQLIDATNTNAKTELVQHINTTNTNTKTELVQMINNIQEKLNTKIAEVEKLNMINSSRIVELEKLNPRIVELEKLNSRIVGLETLNLNSRIIEVEKLGPRIVEVEKLNSRITELEKLNPKIVELEKLNSRIDALELARLPNVEPEKPNSVIPVTEVENK